MAIYSGKRVWVLSDNELFYDLIEANLRSLHVETVRLATGPPAQTDPIGADLIVIALSSPDADPAATLDSTGLSDCIGEVPCMVIAERGLDAGLDKEIIYLDFPPGLHKLRRTATALLAASPL